MQIGFKPAYWVARSRLWLFALTGCILLALAGFPAIVRAYETNRLLHSAQAHILFFDRDGEQDLLLPIDEIPKHVSALPADKSVKIILQTTPVRGGVIAADLLYKLGFSNVWLWLSNASDDP